MFKISNTFLLSILILVLFGISFTVKAQINDIARIDYTIIPSSSDVEFTRVRAILNYPIKLKEDKYLFLGFDYSNIQLNLLEGNYPFDVNQLNDFHLVDLSVGYLAKISEDWRFGIRFRPGFSTNLTSNDITFEDKSLSGELLFIKQWDESEKSKKRRLIVGVSYSENRGFSYPLPFISYSKKFKEKWSYNIGIPRTNLQYHISEKNRVKWLASLDGFTSNVQNGMVLNSGERVKSINMSVIQSGLQYEYHLGKRLEIFARGMYIFDNSVDLRNADRENIFEIDANSKFYFRTGIRCKL
ncbi:MAG: hypothetical protein HRT68_08960 [Flavobacteriaceae bacterium]|nr:hypothetical protein [Flavobacteriaceae bacterium]